MNVEEMQARLAAKKAAGNLKSILMHLYILYSLGMIYLHFH
jgi:hypothetical protein